VAAVHFQFMRICRMDHLESGYGIGLGIVEETHELELAPSPLDFPLQLQGREQVQIPVRSDRLAEVLKQLRAKPKDRFIVVATDSIERRVESNPIKMEGFLEPRRWTVTPTSSLPG